MMAVNDKNCWKMNLLPFSKGYTSFMMKKKEDTKNKEETEEYHFTQATAI